MQTFVGTSVRGITVLRGFPCKKSHAASAAHHRQLGSFLLLKAKRDMSVKPC